MEDVEFLSTRLRQADVQEIKASSGLSPGEALQAGLEYSSECLVATYQEKPFAIFGVAPRTPGEHTGIVWMLGTDDLKTHRFHFLRNSKKWWDYLHQTYRVLLNFVDARNELHIRWLRWMGCDFLRLHEHYGYEGLPFWEFRHVREQPCVKLQPL